MFCRGEPHPWSGARILIGKKIHKAVRSRCRAIGKVLAFVSLTCAARGFKVRHRFDTDFCSSRWPLGNVGRQSGFERTIPALVTILKGYFYTNLVGTQNCLFGSERRRGLGSA